MEEWPRVLTGHPSDPKSRGGGRGLLETRGRREESGRPITI